MQRRTSHILVGTISGLALMAAGAVASVAWNHEGRITRTEEQVRTLSTVENPPAWLADLVRELRHDIAQLNAKVGRLEAAIERGG